MVAALFLVACKPTEDPLAHLTDNVVVTTTEPAFITGSTASCGAEVTADDAGLLIELGVCWSKTANPTIDNSVVKSHKCSQPYICLLTNLEPNTAYHVRGYAKYGTEYVYGSEKTFTTLSDDVPAASPVTTLEATEITYNGFCAPYSQEPFGVTNFTSGLIYSTRPELTMENCEGISIGYYDNETGSYMVRCGDLTPNTKYYYRAFVEYFSNDHYDYFYGDILSLTTLEMPFVLNLTTDYCDFSYGGNYLYAVGYGNCNQPELINQIGFCYSTENEYPQYESDLHTTAATPTGEWFNFYSHIYNISANKKYYVRSYARYMTDSIKYGNVVTVDTY